MIKATFGNSQIRGTLARRPLVKAKLWRKGFLACEIFGDRSGPLAENANGERPVMFAIISLPF